MLELICDVLESLLSGFFNDTGRWVLSFFGLQTNMFAEALLGLLVWILAILLTFALFGALV